MYYHSTAARYLVTLSIVLTASAFSACDDHTPLNHSAKDPNTTHPQFTPPSDGKLTAVQVEDYLRVRKQLLEHLHDTFNDGDSKQLYFDQLEQQFAGKNRLDINEYHWIKNQVITANSRRHVLHYHALNNKILHLLGDTLDTYEANTLQQQPRNEQRLMDGYIGEMRDEMQSLHNKLDTPADETEALRHNMNLLANYHDQLETLAKMQAELSTAKMLL